MNQLNVGAAFAYIWMAGFCGQFSSQVYPFVYKNDDNEGPPWCIQDSFDPISELNLLTEVNQLFVNFFKVKRNSFKKCENIPFFTKVLIWSMWLVRRKSDQWANQHKCFEQIAVHIIYSHLIQPWRWQKKVSCDLWVIMSETGRPRGNRIAPPPSLHVLHGFQTRHNSHRVINDNWKLFSWDVPTRR